MSDRVFRTVSAYTCPDCVGFVRESLQHSVKVRTKYQDVLGMRHLLLEDHNGSYIFTFQGFYSTDTGVFKLTNASRKKLLAEMAFYMK